MLGELEADIGAFDVTEPFIITRRPTKPKQVSQVLPVKNKEKPKVQPNLLAAAIIQNFVELPKEVNIDKLCEYDFSSKYKQYVSNLADEFRSMKFGKTKKQFISHVTDIKKYEEMEKIIMNIINETSNRYVSV